MAEENNVFVMPPPDEPEEQPEEGVFDDQPDFAAPPEDDYAPPEDPYAEDDYIGEVDETAMGGEAPIVLGAPDDDGMMMMMDQDVVPEEPEEPTGPSPMQIWNEQWQETLLVRKDEENAKKAEFIESARLEMEEFETSREQKRENKMAKNRQDEQEKLEAIEADLENDNSWQRVCKMVDLSHDAVQDSVDVSRMRDVLIFLKNDTAKAVELGA